MLSNLSPVKKLVLGLAAMCIAVSVITANNLSSIMMLVAARNNARNNTTVQSNAVQTGTQQGSGSSSSSSGSSSSSSSSSSSGISSSSSSGTSSSSSSGSSSSSSSGSSTGTDSSAAADSNADADKPADSATSTGKPANNAEIAAMYNKAINNAKSSASKIIRVKDGAINYNNIVVAGNLSSIGESLMGMFMVSSPSEIQTTNEEWTAEKFPPENAQAALQESGIKSAKCDEEGDYYLLTIVANDEVNPKSGGPGVGSLCGVIQEETITGSISSVPGLELNNISIAYENVTVVAKIEKSTGNIVNLQIDAPCILSLDAKVPVFGSIEGAQVGIQVITEYSVEY